MVHIMTGFQRQGNTLVWEESNCFIAIKTGEKQWDRILYCLSYKHCDCTTAVRYYNDWMSFLHLAFSLPNDNFFQLNQIRSFCWHQISHYSAEDQILLLFGRKRKMQFTNIFSFPFNVSKRLFQGSLRCVVKSSLSSGLHIFSPNHILSICRHRNKVWQKRWYLYMFWEDRKHCWKRRKCWIPAFLPFLTLFSIVYFFGFLFI